MSIPVIGSSQPGMLTPVNPLQPVQEPSWFVRSMSATPCRVQPSVRSVSACWRSGLGYDTPCRYQALVESCKLKLLLLLLVS